MTDGTVRVDQPLFLISQAQRSGGTLLLRLLDGHPRVPRRPVPAARPRRRREASAVDARRGVAIALGPEAGAPLRGGTPPEEERRPRRRGDVLVRARAGAPAEDLRRVRRRVRRSDPAQPLRLLLHLVLQRLERLREPGGREALAGRIRARRRPQSRAPQRGARHLPGRPRRLGRTRPVDVVCVCEALGAALGGTRGRDRALVQGRPGNAQVAPAPGQAAARGARRQVRVAALARPRRRCAGSRAGSGSSIGRS